MPMGRTNRITHYITGSILILLDRDVAIEEFVPPGIAEVGSVVGDPVEISQPHITTLS